MVPSFFLDVRRDMRWTADATARSLDIVCQRMRPCQRTKWIDSALASTISATNHEFTYTVLHDRHMARSVALILFSGVMMICSPTPLGLSVAQLILRIFSKTERKVVR
jgi:hypothetical protein